MVEADEIWSYCYAKHKNVPEHLKGTPGYGYIWTYTALCADTKLVPFCLVGERTIDDAEIFLTDLDNRMVRANPANAPTATGYTKETVGPYFAHEVDWAHYRTTTQPLRANTSKYSPAVCTGTNRLVLKGDPDPDRI